MRLVGRLLAEAAGSELLVLLVREVVVFLLVDENVLDAVVLDVLLDLGLLLRAGLTLLVDLRLVVLVLLRVVPVFPPPASFLQRARADYECVRDS